MDPILLNSMIQEVRRGCRIDGSWTSQVYTNIVMDLHEAGLSSLKKNHLKNRQIFLKERWREVHDLFGRLSDFVWNQITRCSRDSVNVIFFHKYYTISLQFLKKFN